MSYQTILVERAEGVGTITLNRPGVLNAMNRELHREFDAALTELEDDDEIGAIIVTGSGNRAFSAGGDIKEMAELAKGVDLPPPDTEQGAPRMAPGCVHQANHRRHQRAGLRRGSGDGLQLRHTSGLREHQPSDSSQRRTVG